MAGLPKEFGAKLTQVLKTIQTQTEHSLTDIKYEIGILLGYKGSETLERWRQGVRLPKLKKLELLVRILVDPEAIDSDTILEPVGFDRRWFEELLKYGDYPTRSRASLLDELFPFRPPDDPGPLPELPILPPETPPIADVVGRNREFVALQAQLTAKHFTIVTGMPGIGKSSCVSAFVRRLDLSPERLFWYTLRGLDGLDSIVYRLANFLAYHGESTFLQLLHQGRQPDSILLDQVLLTMSDKGYLLCFDDFHRIRDAEIVNQILTPLLQGAKQGDFDLLIVSREIPPGVYGVDMNSFAMRGLKEEAATQLLSTLNQSPSDEVLSILYELTQGNPQFLIFVAEILAKQQDLKGLFRQIGEKINIERFMMTEVDEHLDDGEQDVMRSISICMEYPATYPLIEEIADQGNLRTALSNLCHRHLLLLHQDPDETRYSQHAIVQQFYYERIPRRDRKAMHIRAAAYYSTEEQDVFKSALHYEKAGEFEQAVEYLIAENTLSLIYQGYALKAGDLLDRLLDKLPKDANVQNEVDLARGLYFRIQGRYKEAISAFSSAIQRVKSSEQQTNLLFELARTYRRQGEFDLALKEFESIMDIYRHNPTLPVDARILNGLGWTYDSLGNLEKARQYFQEVWDTHRDSLTSDVAADTLLGLGSVEWQTGDLDAAEQNLLESRRLFEKTNEIIGRTQSTSSLGIVYFKQDRLDEAFECWDEALEIFQSIGAMNELLIGYNNMASAYILTKQYGAAIQYLSEAVPLAERSQNRQMLSRVYAGLAEAEQGRNQLSRSAGHLKEAQRWASEANLEAEKGIVAYLSAALALAEENYEQALQLVGEAIPLLDKTHESDYLRLSQLLQEEANIGLDRPDLS